MLAPEAFRHEAVLYEGLDEFVPRMTSFIQDGVAANEPVLVVVSAEKRSLLETALGDDAGRVEFGDMQAIGKNPSRIIPVWRDFVRAHAGDGRSLRGIGEPVYPERSPDELVECVRHEMLLNLAFADAPPWWLICPYDVTALPSAVIDEAWRTHPLIARNGRVDESGTYVDIASIAEPFTLPLPEPASVPAEIPIAEGRLDAVRRFVARQAEAFGLSPARAEDAVFAVNEVAANSVRHAGGNARVRAWGTADALIFEIRDGGRIDDPLVGRTRPTSDQESGLGLWLVNQLCDLVQVRSVADGTVVRLHLSR